MPELHNNQQLSTSPASVVKSTHTVMSVCPYMWPLNLGHVNLGLLEKSTWGK